MREIPLIGKRGAGRSSLVDDEDFDSVSEYRWCLLANGYAARTSEGRTIYMHREIQPSAIFTDHANGDRLDNRRRNLRPCSVSQSAMNRAPRSDRQSLYKGVGRSRSRWCARIKVRGKSCRLGTFDTAEEAAIAYDRAALEAFGSFARTNFTVGHTD